MKALASVWSQHVLSVQHPLALTALILTIALAQTICRGGELEPINEERKIGHVLNRIAYGPSFADREHVQAIGVKAYIEEQLNPDQIKEATSSTETRRTKELFFDIAPGSGRHLVKQGEVWRYRRGNSPPPKGWMSTTFNDSNWDTGASGFGYGDDDDETELKDMEGTDDQLGYLSLYVRKEFEILDLDSLEKNLFMRIQYDDGFVAYLNGKEVCRSNMRGTFPAHDQPAIESSGTVDRGATDTFPLSTANRTLLKQGRNVLAIQVHNHEVDSSDLSLIPELLHAPDPAFPSIKGVQALQQLTHLRGIYSKRQLQSVMADFWENHFCTDFDKLEDYIDDLPLYERLQSQDGEQLVERQIRTEAATAEWQEYEFFYDNALGHFGDLLLYSATSPSMLVYLDSVLNVKSEPNENFAREILELYACGVDNRYTQEDIEELARCFTGWTLRKIDPAEAPAFPVSSRTPPIEPSLSVENETPLLALGSEWKYWKGFREPSPDRRGKPTTDWTLPGFNDGKWYEGETGLGYGDGDDATLLRDMSGRYVSVYLRKSIALDVDTDADDLVLEIAYDDGYVAYLNGQEIGRSGNIRSEIKTGEPPAFDFIVPRNHEADEGVDTIDLRAYRSLINPPPALNTIAIQAHNGSKNSSDFSILPKVVARDNRPGSIPLTDPHGKWTFRFQPEQHDTGEKVIFKGTDQEIRIPSGRRGREGVNDAIDVIDALVAHPSSSEFIVIKLVNKFVSDDIALESYHDRSAPKPLIALVDEAIAAWKSTQRPGDIRTVMRVILDPVEQAGPFWTTLAYQSKIKTPVEFINSAFRALNANIAGEAIAERAGVMGMDLFRRDDPDGFPEAGPDWMNTQSLLERIRFSQALTINDRESEGRWSLSLTMAKHKLRTAEDVLNYFDHLLFDGHLSNSRKAVILNFANTDDNGYASPVTRLTGKNKMHRLEQMVGMILSTQEFQFQ